MIIVKGSLPATRRASATLCTAAAAVPAAMAMAAPSTSPARRAERVTFGSGSTITALNTGCIVRCPRPIPRIYSRGVIGKKLRLHCARVGLALRLPINPKLLVATAKPKRERLPWPQRGEPPNMLNRRAIIVAGMGLFYAGMATAQAADSASPNDSARFLAGMPVDPESPLAPLTKEATWQQHAHSLDAGFGHLGDSQLARIRT